MSDDRSWMSPEMRACDDAMLGVKKSIEEWLIWRDRLDRKSQEPGYDVPEDVPMMFPQYNLHAYDQWMQVVVCNECGAISPMAAKEFNPCWHCGLMDGTDGYSIKAGKYTEAYNSTEISRWRIRETGKKDE